MPKIKKYRAYYKVGFASEESCRMVQREHEFSAKNTADAFVKLDRFFNRLKKEMGESYKFFLTNLEKFESVTLRCPSCKGEKELQVEVATQVGKHTRRQICQGCNGAGKLPGNPSWSVRN